jgi:hypothetical protein
LEAKKKIPSFIPFENPEKSEPFVKKSEFPNTLSTKHIYIFEIFTILKKFFYLLRIFIGISSYPCTDIPLQAFLFLLLKGFSFIMLSGELNLKHKNSPVYLNCLTCDIYLFLISKKD